MADTNTNDAWRKRAHWKVPALFCNDWVCLKLAQAIVNHVCPSTCPLYAEHSVIVEQDILAGKREVTRCWRGESSDATRCLSDGLMEELVEHGFVNMKIAGRSYTPYHFAQNVLRFVEGDADYADALIPELMKTVKFASLPYFDESKYCRLPEQEKLSPV